MARKKLETLTEQMFYVLLSLRRERHGYGIMQAITEMTGGRVSVGAGTLYALLERFEKDGLIRFTRTEENRKYYQMTEAGEQALPRKRSRRMPAAQPAEHRRSARSPRPRAGWPPGSRSARRNLRLRPAARRTDCSISARL